VKTYAWIRATAASRVRRIIWRAKSMLKITDEVMYEVWDPKSVKRRWPAIIFAESRTVKVPGRIILLIDSINTIKGIRRLGVLNGTKWANI